MIVHGEADSAIPVIYGKHVYDNLASSKKELYIMEAAGRKRALRTTGVLLIGLAVVDLVAPLFPMHLREDIRQTGATLTDTMHITITGVTVLLILLVIGFGAAATGKWFRTYSYTTILVLVLCGTWSALDVPRITPILPTPWLGEREHFNICGYMLWMAVLASVRLTAQRKRNSFDSSDR